MTYFCFYFTYICIASQFMITDVSPKTANLSPILLYEYVQIHPDRQIDLHSQNSWELDYILVGSGRRVIGNWEDTFEEGEIVLVPPEIPHCWNFDGGRVDAEGNIVNITLIFNDLLIDRILSAFPMMEKSITELRNQDAARMFFGAVRDNLAAILTGMRFESADERAASFLRVLTLVSRHRESKPIGTWRKIDPVEHRMMQIRTYVSCNATREITLQEIAAHVGMNVSAFCTFFKRQTAQTFVDYLNKYRLDIACHLLEEGKLSVSEVCFASGFNNPAYFSRLFKKMYGVPPSDYRGHGSR